MNDERVYIIKINNVQQPDVCMFDQDGKYVGMHEAAEAAVLEYARTNSIPSDDHLPSSAWVQPARSYYKALPVSVIDEEGGWSLDLEVRRWRGQLELRSFRCEGQRPHIIAEK